MTLRLVLFLLGNTWLMAISSPCVQGQPKQSTVATAAKRICWQEGRRLEWGDFKAVKCYGEAGKHPSTVGAATAVVVPVVGYVNAQGMSEYRVTCIFLRDSSWVNPRLTAPTDQRRTLAHEQLHFNIAELFARKIRYRVAQHRAAGDELFGPVVAQNIQCLLTEWDTLDDLYDEEVNFRPPAVEAAAQRRWELRLARELRALDRYKSTATTCPD